MLVSVPESRRLFTAGSVSDMHAPFSAPALHSEGRARQTCCKRAVSSVRAARPSSCEVWSGWGPQEEEELGATYRRLKDAADEAARLQDTSPTAAAEGTSAHDSAAIQTAAALAVSC